MCLTTKIGDKPVGAILRSSNSTGALALLPNIDFSPDEFFEDEPPEDDEDGWTEAARQFAIRFISAIVALDKALRSSSDITPEPNWAAEPKYALTTEESLRAQLLEAEIRVEAAQKEKENVQEQLREAGKLRALLFEKGKPLESAIIEALKLMQFKAAPYKQSDSEFDVVFESEEGRFLGEAEGKDTKAVNVDKLRQLTMNILEDLERDEVSQPAKGVLFGNGYRLAPPADRQNQFTEKCISASNISSVALVPTTELFIAAQHLSADFDPAYAKECRETMLNGIGVVTLPRPMSLNGIVRDTQVDEAQQNP